MARVLIAGEKKPQSAMNAVFLFISKV